MAVASDTWSQEALCSIDARGLCPRAVQHRATMRYLVTDPARVRARTLADLKRIGGWASCGELHRAGHYRFARHVRESVLADLLAAGLIEWMPDRARPGGVFRIREPRQEAIGPN